MSNDNENNSENLGGLQIAPANPNPSDNPPNSLGSASAEVIAGRKKRSDAGQPRGARTTSGQKSVSGILAPQAFAALYDETLWGRVLASPADAAAALTGAEEWKISEEERKTLGKTGSVAAQCFAVADPRWLAVSLALIAVIDIYGVRFAMYKARKDAEKKKAIPQEKT